MNNNHTNGQCRSQSQPCTFKPTHANHAAGACRRPVNRGGYVNQNRPRPPPQVNQGYMHPPQYVRPQQPGQGYAGGHQQQYQGVMGPQVVQPPPAPMHHMPQPSMQAPPPPGAGASDPNLENNTKIEMTKKFMQLLGL